MLTVIALAVTMVLVTAMLSVIESAIICVDDLRLATLLRKKPTYANDIQYIIHHKREHLSSIVLLITLISIAGSSVTGILAAQVFGHIGLIVFTALLTYGLLVFAKILPKLIAVQIADRVLERMAPTIKYICCLLKPLLWITLIWVKLLRFRRANANTASRDDLKSIIHYYGVNGVICPEESNIVAQALNVHDKQLKDLSANGTPMMWLSADETVDSAFAKVKQSPFKRYVVMTQGQATGVVLYRHLARSMLNGDSAVKIGTLMRQAIFLAPETTLLEALAQFKSAKASVAILSGVTPEASQCITAKQVYRAVLQQSA